MENDAATLYCSNELCQAANPLTHKFCQRCSTPLPKRYLWAVADGLIVGNPGEVLADRYLVISKAVLLDTKPGLLPQTPDLENLQAIRPYLRLFPYRLYVPQVYGVLPLITEGTSGQEILLLEKPPLNLDNTLPLKVQLGSELTTAWRDATSLRQLNWLWQLAHLWQPLVSEGVAKSLLDPELIRVEGSLVRLLELRFDHQTSPSLPQFGEFWQQLLPAVKPAIAEFVGEICRFLIEGKIHSGEQLIALLDKGLAELGRSQTTTIKISTKSDTGPSRQRNEDACYPSSGTTITKPPHPTALAIVCDGIGGHEGGNVASKLAIETIQQQVQALTKVPYDHIDPAILLADLERAAAVANDKISQRNDSENRQGRQRMGTTLVMGLPVAHEIYIAHVGDSRAYWITPKGCHQVTLDDDVASREVRLGYAVYRDALQQGASGSLIQALGMSPSSSLHPTVQRFILDEDSVFLLCSDGLSDFDRVEQYWETEIQPILSGKLDVAKVTEKLVEIANNQNGHDNVTVAIVHCQVKYSEPKSNLKPVLADLSAIKLADYSRQTALTPRDHSQNQKTQVIPELASAKGSKVPLLLVVILLLFVGSGLLGYSWRQGWLPFLKFPATTTVPGNNPDPVTPSTPPSDGSFEGFKVNMVFLTKSEIAFPTVQPPPTEALIPVGSVLQIIGIENSWVRLRVCSIGKIATPSTPTGNKPLVNARTELSIPFSKFKSYPIVKLEATSQCQAKVKVPVESPPTP